MKFQLPSIFSFFLFCFSLARADISAPPKPEPIKLQWFNSHGELVDLDWPISVQRIWKDPPALEDDQSPSPWLQLWIDLPEQLDLTLEEDQQTRILKGAEQEDGSQGRQVLILETKSPNVTQKMELKNEEGEAQKVGLMITLPAEAPQVLLHPSCRKEGVSIQEAKKGAKFLFIAAFCKRDKKNLEVRLSLSDDAAAINGSGQPFADEKESKSFTYHVPEKALKNFAVAQLIGKARVANKLGREFSEFEIGLHRPEKPEVVAPPPVRKPKPKAVPLLSKPRKVVAPSFAASLNTPYLTYTKAGDPPSPDPSEYNLELGARFEHELDQSGVGLEGELNIPLWTLLPKPFHIPASGIYELAGRIAWPALALDKSTKLTVFPGISADFIRFDERPSDSAVRLGFPMLIAIEGQIARLDGRAYELRLGITPLMGGAPSPFFNGFRGSVQFALQVTGQKNLERRWDLLLKFDEASIKAQNGQSVGLTKFSVGAQLWY